MTVAMWIETEKLATGKVIFLLKPAADSLL